MAEVFFDEFDPETVDQGGAPLPGKCQLLVADVEDKGEYLSVTNEIVAHEKSSEVGKVSFNAISLTGKAAKRALLFALATQLITKQQIADAKIGGGNSLNIDYDKAVGRVYYGTLVASDYQGKKKCRVEWDFKPLGSEDAKDYPQNPSYAPVKEIAKPKQQPRSAANNRLANNEIPF